MFRGGSLVMSNPVYRENVERVLKGLLAADAAGNDLTVAALGLEPTPASAQILAREPGTAAGVDEFSSLLQGVGAGVEVTFIAKDGDAFESGDVLAHLKGTQIDLLSTERVGLNLLQRMCGIATAARRLQKRVAKRNPEARVVATRKTPWGLLDKRAVDCGGAGTHRISLGDAILIKNNHLKLIADSEEEAAPHAIRRAWQRRTDSAFIEVEVRSIPAAVAAAEIFRRLREEEDETYPCLILLDNMAPREIARAVDALRQKRVWDHVLIEASGGICESNIEDYAEYGADAISVGALTHSARALDLCQRIS